MPYSLILGTSVVAEDNSIHVQITVCSMSNVEVLALDHRQLGNCQKIILQCFDSPLVDFFGRTGCLLSLKISHLPFKANI